MSNSKAIMIKELKEVMEEVRERWKHQGLDIKVFFDEVLMNIKSMPQWQGQIK